MSLTSLLQNTFAFRDFRANQEAVCQAAAEGSDVLLVMPTGAGKSLCYQLPAIARGGTALVVSPLIALMDDQAAKLQSAGLRVARIHSGLSREESRHACRDYLDGALQFLFIAPERMRVPGFPEMLAKRKPSLIAIDEAHCISAWGHDFRPDYRTLGEHLPALRPAPVVALTATATPAVQHDIVKQLQLREPRLFIHGFRRENLAIEVVEIAKPQRKEVAASILADKARRPAIVYAPSRKEAEELAGELSRHFPAAAYHAGLPAGVREKVQRAFQRGELECVVATIAFGMGIDKADVRTVVHAALPSSVEGYYQEIGRAGRDRLPSRTVLLYSFADRRLQEFFLERNYPVATELARVLHSLTDVFVDAEMIRHKLKMDAETFSRAVEKLVAQEAVSQDIAGGLRRGRELAWQSGYAQQVAFRQSQIDSMMNFATTQQCRMTALIRHFGDSADAYRPCGHCDFCQPGAAIAQKFVTPDTGEEKHLRSILRALQGQASKATGRLFTELATVKDRDQFEALLDGLARAGLVSIAPETWVSPEGKVVAFKKACLTHEGKSLGETDDLGVFLRSNQAKGKTTKSTPSSSGAPRFTRKRDAGRSDNQGQQRRASLPAGLREGDAQVAPKGVFRREDRVAAHPADCLNDDQRALDERLRSWRKAEAAKMGLPQFFVLGTSTLRSIVVERPRTLSALRGIHGIGQEKLDRFGASILEVCNG